MCEVNKPTDQALTTDLNIQWQDHWDMRTQMWRTIQVSAALVIGLIGASNVGPSWFAGAVGAILIVTSAIGIAIVHHLRECQKKKFALILRIEEELGLFKRIYWFDNGTQAAPPNGNDKFHRVGVSPPGSEEGWKKGVSTPNLIVVLHFLIAGGALVYVVGILIGAIGYSPAGN